MKSYLFILFSLLFFSHTCFAQSFEGEIILQFGGEDWKDWPAAPVITYVKGGKTLTKIITPFFGGYIYTDRATGKIISIDAGKKTGREFAFDTIKERARKQHTLISEPIPSGEKQRIRNSVFDFFCERYTADIKKDGVKISGNVEIWVADVNHYLPKGLLDVLKTSFPFVIAGFFRGNMLELADYFNKFFDKGLMPIEFGVRKKDEKEIESKIDFIWYDEIKLDDSTFVVPPDIKIGQ